MAAQQPKPRVAPGRAWAAGEPAGAPWWRVIAVRSWLREYWPELISAASTIFFAGWSVWASGGFPSLTDPKFWISHGGWVAALVAIAWTVTGVCIVRRRQSCAKLTSDLGICQEELARMHGHVRAIIDATLMDIARPLLEFGKRPDNSERISAYRFDHDTGGFVLVGRFSDNPDFSTTGRPVYPGKQGCIGDAWANGKGVLRLPAPGCEAEPAEDYVVCHQKSGLDAETVRGLRMWSRLLYARRLEDSGSPVAVVVVEATEARRWSEDDLDHAFSDDLCRRLTELLVSLAKALPRPLEAQQRGLYDG